MNSPHKWPVTRKIFPFDDVIMTFRRILWDVSTDPYSTHSDAIFLIWKKNFDIEGPFSANFSPVCWLLYTSTRDFLLDGNEVTWSVPLAPHCSWRAILGKLWSAAGMVFIFTITEYCSLLTELRRDQLTLPALWSATTNASLHAPNPLRLRHRCQGRTKTFTGKAE